MNKKKFQKLIESSQELSDSELGQLEELQNDYPFSQVIHAVVAKSSLRKGTTNAQSKLGQAAIYSTNRKVLKNFIELETGTSLIRSAKSRVKATEKKIPAKDTTKAETKVSQKISDTPSKETIQAKQTKDSEDETKAQTVSTPPSPSKLLKKSPENKQIEEKKSVEPLQKKPIQISPPQRSVKRIAPSEMDLLREEVMNNLKELKGNIKNFEKEDAASQKKSKSKKPKSTKKVKEELPELNKPAENDLIDQIHSLKEKKVGAKQKKQHQLIEEFVKRDPEKREAKVQDPDKEVSDLARESVNFNEELVSENLAIIFAKQGKTDKAIEIYKKLIWKYPQKKSYFATQIEDLEKK